MFSCLADFTFNLRLRFSIVPPSDASPISVKLFALSVDIILYRSTVREFANQSITYFSHYTNETNQLRNNWY